MATANSILMSEARENLKGKWWMVVQVTFIFMFFLLASSSVGPIVGLIVTGPVYMAMNVYFLSFSRNEKPRINDIFNKVNTFELILRAIKTYALATWYIFWWSLLLIIPGIIKSLSYSQIYYILSDNPHMGTRKALEKSSEMMNGHKWDLFCLGLRFLGWSILAILTLGIGLLWLIPYIQVTMARFYDSVK